jgi:hypothetical protein
VATKLGDLIDQTVVVGGLVPSLIIEQGGTDPHVGTLDLHIGLALALFDSKRYEELAQRMRQAGFSEDVNEDGRTTRQRWRIQQPHAVTVDFLIALLSPDAFGGTLQNIEPDFAAIITPGLHLAFVDQIEVELDGLTVLNERAKRTVRVAPPLRGRIDTHLALPAPLEERPGNTSVRRARSREGTPGPGALRWLEPLQDLATRRPLRALGIALGGLLPAFGVVGTFQFTGYFTQTVHGWSPQNYAALVGVAGGAGVIGNLASGRLADRFGRRIVGAAQLASFPLFAALFYRGRGSVLPIAWACCVFRIKGAAPFCVLKRRSYSQHTAAVPRRASSRSSTSSAPPRVSASSKHSHEQGARRSTTSPGNAPTETTLQLPERARTRFSTSRRSGGRADPDDFFR